MRDPTCLACLRPIPGKVRSTSLVAAQPIEGGAVDVSVSGQVCSPECATRLLRLLGIPVVTYRGQPLGLRRLN